MKHKIYSIMAAAAAITALAGCEKENAFLFNEGEGQLNTGSLSVDYINSGRETRAGVNVDDFTVNFINTGTQNNEIIKSYKYSEMPEVVALPQGNYKAEAVYGDDPISEWETPYYLGNSEFDIKAGKITDDVPAVECELSNIRINVNITDLGQGLLTNDAQVVVEAGKEGCLTYDQTESRAGYFRYDGSNTIIASFSGTVDGVYVDNVKRTYSNAAAGNAYTINFTVNKPDNLEPGDITIGDGTTDGITIDATIAIQDQNVVIDPNEPDDNLLVDDMRPVEDPVTPPDNPDDNPDNPDDPTPPAAQGPQITNLAPGIVLDQCCTITPESEVYFTIESKTGLTGFTIHIESDKLTPAELKGVGLAADLDLINPGNLEEALTGLGFLDGTPMEGAKTKEFSITGFVPMLFALGSGEHKFHLTITDESGTTQATLWLKCN